MDIAQVQAGFVAAGIPAYLVDATLECYAEVKRRYYLGDHRPQEVEGGRFSEAVFRILQHSCGQPITPLGKSLPTVNQLILQLENVPTPPDSIRLHIPRTLRLIYDVRNKRDAAHLADGIDPNLQDCTLIIAAMDWVMAELVRLYHGVDASEAQRIIDDLVTKEVPAIQEVDGQPVILKELQPREQALLMLYRAGSGGATLDELAGDLRVDRKNDLKRRLLRLDEEKLVLHHPKTGRFHLTIAGVRIVEQRRLAQPPPAKV